MKIACLNNIAEIGINQFTSKYQFVDNQQEADLILVRSFNMHDMEVPPHLLAVARAGAGVNNIPLDAYAKQGIVVFNTPGANANGVKELVIAGMLLASRDLVGGILWVQTHNQDEAILKSIEKAKAAFGGTEILGKTIGVIGLGAVGGKVANSCHHLGLKVIGYDPYLSDDLRKELVDDIQITSNLEDIYKNADFVTLHLPLLDSTRKMINESVFNQMKKGLILLNFSRDELVSDDDLEQAIEEGIIRKYVTDFPNFKTANMNNVIPLPHLGASTEESEENCAIMASQELMKFVEEGSIINSVNYPKLDAGKKTSKTRLLILHESKELINQFMQVLSGINIVNLVIKTRGAYGATLIDMDCDLHVDYLTKLSQIDGVIKTRLI